MDANQKNPANVEVLPGTGANACDLISYLAGVNYYGTIRVLTALNAVAQATGLPVDVVASTLSIPAETLNPSNRAHTPRLKAVSDWVAKAQAQKQLDEFLPNLAQRHRKHES